MVNIDGQLYYLDINAITEFVFKKSDEEQSVEQQLLYGNKNTLVQQTDIIKHNDDKYTQIRYDLIKNMLDVVYNSGVESEEGGITYIQSMDDNSIGSKLIFNTLLINGFVKNKLD